MEEDQDPPSLHDLIHDTALARRILPPDLSDDLSAAYLDNLVSLPLVSLQKEPTLISAEATSVESELTNLCYREYSTFLSVHDCSAAVTSAFDDFQNSLGQLLDSVPLLEAECRTFVKKSQALTTTRNRSTLLQDHRDKLLDLLELPRLMETCVRNGYYQEAMELAAHGKDLQTRYTDVRLCLDIAREIDGVEQLMLAQLLSLLREPVKLPTVMKTIGYLRRLGMMDEASLGWTFLSGRLHNFRTQLLQIEKDRGDPVRYLRKYIDIFREHVYDILSQFSAVFDEFNLLVSFAEQCVADMIELVSTYVPRISQDTASLSSILIQLGYCSLSFARIGLDFAPLIAESFAGTISSSYAQAVTTASDHLTADLAEATKAHTAPIETIVNPEQRTALLASSPSFDFSDGTPIELNAFPSLAHFLNEHHAAFNVLRLLAPTSLYNHLRAVLADTLAVSTRTVLGFVREATAVPDAPNGRPAKHSRTPSSPRSHLLRRNTETQLAPGVRAVKRIEAQQICVSFAQAWTSLAGHLWTSVVHGIFDRPAEMGENSLGSELDHLQSWITSNRPAAENGEETNESAADSATAVDLPKPGGQLEAIQARPYSTASIDDPFLVAKSTTEHMLGEAPTTRPIVAGAEVSVSGHMLASGALLDPTPNADEGVAVAGPQPDEAPSAIEQQPVAHNEPAPASDSAEAAPAADELDHAKVVEPMFAATPDAAHTVPDELPAVPVALIIPRNIVNSDEKAVLDGSGAEEYTIVAERRRGHPTGETMSYPTESVSTSPPESEGQGTPVGGLSEEASGDPQPSDRETSLENNNQAQNLGHGPQLPTSDDPGMVKDAHTADASLPNTPEESIEDTVSDVAGAEPPQTSGGAGSGQQKKKKKKKKKS